MDALLLWLRAEFFRGGDLYGRDYIMCRLYKKGVDGIIGLGFGESLWSNCCKSLNLLSVLFLVSFFLIKLFFFGLVFLVTSVI